MNENIVMSRRTLLVGCAAGAAALAVGGAVASTDSAHASAVASQPDGKQYGFLVNTSNCVNCGACVQACREINQTPEDAPARRKITVYTREGGDSAFVSTSCMHCANPSCADVCPAKAITKGAGGIVVVDESRCIGCKYCYQACPFAVPQFDEISMDKCDCCVGNGVRIGDQPHCAKACRFDALHYGLLADLAKKAKGTPIRVEASTEPSFLLA